MGLADVMNHIVLWQTRLREDAKSLDSFEVENRLYAITLPWRPFPLQSNIISDWYLTTGSTINDSTSFLFKNCYLHIRAFDPNSHLFLTLP